MTADAALNRLDTVALAELIRAGELSPLELVDATIARIEALDGSVNAVIHRSFERAREQASSPDELPDGPFRGVPWLVKDLWPASAGDPFHLGVKALKEVDYRHPTDTNLVTRYREAGFILLGRTNTPELGLSATTEPRAYGATHNPWNLEHGPGGSSGGAAAAVAAGMVPAANASDGGGSIRIPAAMCGVVGLKPSRGRSSMGPMQDEWSDSVQHAVTHTVRDSAALLDVISEPFIGDGVIAPRPDRPFADFVGADPGTLRIGVTTESRPDVETHPECAAATQSVAALLECVGHRVEPSSPEALHDETAMERYGLFALVGVANMVDELAQFVGRPLSQDDVEPGTWLMTELAAGITGVQVAKAQSERHRYRREMTSWWAEGWDLLLTPTTAQPPPPLGQLVPTVDDPYRGQMASIPYSVFTSPFNVTGLPGISVPAGFTADGLPVGAQLVANYGREDLLIQVAAQVEAELNWADNRAPLHP